MAFVNGSTRLSGGFHTYRNIEDSIQAQLRDVRADLERQIETAARVTGELAFRRMESLVVPAVGSLRERLDGDLPLVLSTVDKSAADLRAELAALRSEIGADLEQLRGEVSRLGGSLAEVASETRRAHEAVAATDAARGELAAATQSWRAGFDDVAGQLHARISEMTQATADVLEAKWCGPMQARVKAVESLLKVVAERARNEAAATVDTVNLIESQLVGRLDELKTQAFEEARRRAAETKEAFKEEVLQGQIVQQFQRRLDDSQVLFERQLADQREQLLEQLRARVSEAAATADQVSARRVAELSANLTEVLEATRNELAEQARVTDVAAEARRTELRDVKKNVEALDALQRAAVKGVHDRCRGLADDSSALREELVQIRRSNMDGIAGVRSEMQERALEWRAFEMSITGASLEPLSWTTLELKGSQRAPRLETEAASPGAATAVASLGTSGKAAGEPSGPLFAASPFDRTASTQPSDGLAMSAASSPLPPLTASSTSARRPC